MTDSRALRLYSWLVRLALPRRFRSRFEQALLDAAHDGYLVARRSGNKIRLRFWLRELLGLARLAVRERLEAAGDWFDAALHRPNHPPTQSGWYEMLHTIRQDLTYAVRMILKTPFVSFVAVMSLAIGIAANTTIFSVLNRWLLRPLPYPNADQLVMVWEAETGDADTYTVTPGNFAAWKEEGQSFSAWIASHNTTRTLTGIDHPEQVTAAEVTPNYFQVLQAASLLGRGFAADEGGPEDEPVVILNETLWRTRFGADSSTLGRTVLLDGTAHTVIGIMPENFDFLIGSVDLWTANTFDALRDDRTNRMLLVSARLRPGVSANQAQVEMTGLASRLATRFPETNESVGVDVDTVRETFPGPTDSGLIRILAAVVSLVLVVACVNVASLLLAKTDARHRELGIRSALGAGRGRIARQLLTESVVLASIAGGLGLVLAIPGIAAVATAMPDELPAFFAPAFDGVVVAFGVGLSLVAGLVFGISPVSQVLTGTTLSEHTRGGSSGRMRKRLRSAFVVSEFALALAILIGAAVLTDLFSRRLSVDPGFDVANLLTVQVTPPEYKYETDEQLIAFTNRLEERSGELPGVTAYAFASALPRSMSMPSTEFSIEGQPPVEEDKLPSASWLSVNPSYFRALEAPLRQGRAFTLADREDMPRVAVVNQRFVDRYLDGGPAIGTRLIAQAQTWEIVGVATDVAQERMDGLLPIAPAVYFPLAQHPVRNLHLIFRTEGDPQRAAPAVQEMVAGIDPEQPVFAIQTMAEHFAMALAGPTIMSKILLIVGALALALAAIGIYGVMAYNVSLQSREIGIRMALGANPGRVLRTITGQGVWLAGLGLIIGAPLATTIVVLIARVLADPTGFGGVDTPRAVTVAPIAFVLLSLITVGSVASLLPARRAVRLDPVRVLGAE